MFNDVILPFVKILLITFGVDSLMHNLNGRSISAVS